MGIIQYAGEHVAAGQLGRALIALAFVCALLATIAGIKATQLQRKGITDSGWTGLTGSSFSVMGLSIIGVMGLLITMMTQHWFEYQYVQAHVNDELPFKYIFTAFWEGQEGSFLLWLMWHSVLGMVVWFINKSWRLPVLAIIASVQVILLSMLLGVYVPFVDDVRIGASPFLLLREAMDAPIFAQADYVDLIEGKGLNPLLQNYWMLIHPPTLFLGFASTLMPFAFGVAALWTKRYKEWLQPALRWSLFSGGILGIGILMGGAWAYEALNFGGYWAWDPVENSSLVPWLLIVAGIHTNLVAKATGHSIRSTFLFYILGFLGILYSSFLTRSGVLGETSVHAFTEMGLEVQLMLLVGLFGLLGFGFAAYRWKQIPTKPTEEASTSREFWMFLGSLVLLFSAGMITASTSLPVFNKLGDAMGFDFGHLTINEPIAHYNRYQLWVGVFMGLFTGVAHYMRWRTSKAPAKPLLIRLGGAFVISAALAVLTSQYLADTAYQFSVLAFAAYFALLSNIDYLVSSKVSLWQRVGSFSSHFGFGLLLLGVLFSGLNKHHISKNVFAMDGLLGEEQIGKNVFLVKGLPMVINGYEVTYLADTLVGNRRDFTVQYREMTKDAQLGRSFELKPYALYTNDFAKIASMNPDTKHYWDHDVFTHISGLPPASQSAEQATAFEDSLQYQRVELALGDTASSKKHILQLVEIIESPSHPDYTPEPGDIALGAKVRVQRNNFDTSQTVTPVVVLRENLVYSYPAQVDAFNVRVQLPEQAFAARYADERSLDYQTYELAPGAQASLGGATFTFKEFSNEAQHINYFAEEGDVAVNAVLDVTYQGKRFELKPLYFIRGNSPANLKDFAIEGLGFHARIEKIDPASGKATFRFAVDVRPATAMLPVEIAENSSRADWVVLEATVFPGINLVWVGSLMMLFGLLIAMTFRIKAKRQAVQVKETIVPIRQVRQKPVAV